MEISTGGEVVPAGALPDQNVQGRTHMSVDTTPGWADPDRPLDPSLCYRPVLRLFDHSFTPSRNTADGPCPESLAGVFNADRNEFSPLAGNMAFRGE